MLKIIHRINTIEELKTINTNYGVEIDLRVNKNKIILNHDAFGDGDDLEEYLKKYKHKFIILNIKEDGIEDKVIESMKNNNINDYFLLDVEFPYIYRSINDGNKKIAIRYSEAEPIEQALVFKGKANYLWIDTNTKLPLNIEVIKKMKGFETCLVSPDRWGRPEDILKYKEKMLSLGFKLDMVMVGKEYIDLW